VLYVSSGNSCGVIGTWRKRETKRKKKTDAATLEPLELIAS
jgi:hypothetical protein